MARYCLACSRVVTVVAMATDAVLPGCQEMVNRLPYSRIPAQIVYLEDKQMCLYSNETKQVLHQSVCCLANNSTVFYTLT